MFFLCQINTYNGIRQLEQLTAFVNEMKKTMLEQNEQQPSKVGKCGLFSQRELDSMFYRCW